MTKDDIIQMAREAGFHCYNGCVDGIDADLERFAALVADAEREACAQAAGPEDSYQDEWFKAKADSVQRIRARGETK